MPEIDVVRWISAIIFIGGLLYAFLYITTKNFTKNGENSSIKIVSRTMLTRDNTILVVEFEDQRFLLGSGKEGVSFLTYLAKTMPSSKMLSAKDQA